MIKLYETYNKAKDVFVKPKLHWYFGKWRHDPCLPVWRRGPIWWIGGSTYNINAKCYNVNDRVHVKVGTKDYPRMDGSIYTCDVIKTSIHKLPGGLRANMPAWKRKYRKLFRKFGLKIFKAYIQFPIWMSFHIFNSDIVWKTKWTDYDFRYEFPGHFTIVFFGLSLSFWLYPELKEDTDSPNYYWESILMYLYGPHAGDLLQTVVDCGKWTQSYKEKSTEYFALSKSYIKPEYYDLHKEATELYEELIKNKKDDE